LAVDASASLPDGSRFDGVAGLRSLLVSHREDFVRTFADRLLSYAIGRGTEDRDQPAVRRIVRESAAQDHRWSAMILGIVRSTRFLTDVSPPTSETWLDAGISVDQILANEAGKHTQLASLELAIESSETAGACDVGFACAYTNTISWRSANTPLPTERNPRVVFERLFGDSGSTTPQARRARIAQDRSVLDSVIAEAQSLSGSIGAGDRVKLVEYLDAIRDVERRIARAEEQSARELPVVDHPAGVPDSFDEHVTLMCDLQVLAYQADLTRVITFMLGREFSGVTFPQIGVPDAH